MSHTNQTPNYHLPQFIGTDKPAWLVDFNQAMSDIDTQMKANETASGTAEADAQSALSGVTALNSQVGGIQTSVTALETQAPLDEAQIETNRQNIATNAQNIVDLDNRMGHTSITGIGDGSATGAIKAVDDKVGDLSDLDTTDKSSVVDAINEIVAGGGGDMSTVRYNNGYIQYTPDNGTTWVNLINVSTPVQLLPVMDSNVNAFGTASCTSPAYTATAYGAIDGSVGQVFVSAQEELKFEFTNAQYVNDFKITYWNAGTYNHSARCEYTEDGVTWLAGDGIVVAANDSTEREYSYHIGKTVKAIKFVNSDASGSAGNFGLKKMEAWN